MSPAVNILTWVVRIAVGTLFIFSGFVKANDITGFAYKLDDYWQVFATDFPMFESLFTAMKPWSFFLSWFLSVFEISVGFALIVGFLPKVTNWILLAMIVFFTFLTGYSFLPAYAPTKLFTIGLAVALLPLVVSVFMKDPKKSKLAILSSVGLFAIFFLLSKFTSLLLSGEYKPEDMKVTDCGCFGDAIKLTPYQSFMKDLILLVLSVFLFARRKDIQPFPNGKIAAIVSLASFAGFGYFSYYCYRHLPAIDFISGYKIGANIPKNMQTFDDEGIPVVHDFYEFCANCYEDSAKGIVKSDGFKGTTLYVVIYNPAEANEEDIKATVVLAGEVSKKLPQLKMCGGTNVPDDLAKYNIPFPISGQDEKALKTMLRSSPGYMLLKDGIVVKKWSYADVPEVTELAELIK